MSLRCVKLPWVKEVDEGKKLEDSPFNYFTITLFLICNK